MSWRLLLAFIVILLAPLFGVHERLTVRRSSGLACGPAQALAYKSPSDYRVAVCALMRSARR
jgi:hypothetical protein